ncbi:hypothetical protein IG631_09544, partial [Alternaria alternata]
RIISCNYNA